jgi:hypothetical protein
MAPRPSLERPAPPFVELSFYLSDLPDDQGLRKLVGCLERRGASPTGRVMVHVPPDATMPFGGPTDFEQRQRRISGFEDLGRLSEEEGCRLVAVEVSGLFSYDRGHFAIATLLRIGEHSVGSENHPVAVWASGDAFSGPQGRRAMAAGAEVRTVFVELASCIEPSYGAITFDWPLGTPASIAADPKAGSDYRDFYLGRAYAGEGSLSRVEAAAAGLGIEHAGSGLFVFSTPAFGGPTGLDHRPAGAALGRAIANRSRR